MKSPVSSRQVLPGMLACTKYDWGPTFITKKTKASGVFLENSYLANNTLVLVLSVKDNYATLFYSLSRQSHMIDLPIDYLQILE
jgi:hypothetical protein